MKKLLAIIFLLLATSLYASEATTNYELVIPSIGDRDWQPALSRDIVSIDTIMGILSSDRVIDMASVSALSTKVTIISNDSVIQNLNTQIISNDSVIQDIKIQIISNDTIIDKLSTDIISNDLIFVRNYTLPSVAPTAAREVISWDGAVLKWGTIPSSGSGDVLYADTRFKVGQTTRAMDAATGNVAYTGVGFSPKGVIFYGTTEANAITSIIGFSAGTGHVGMADNQNITANNFTINGSNSIYLIEAAGKNQTGSIASYDADGFTITWTRTGVTAGATCNITYMAFR